MIKILTPFLYALLIFASDINASSNKDIDLLLVTGRSNKYHSWEGSSKAVEQHLRDAGIFSVNTYITSPSGESLKDFAPNWHDYDVVVLDYEGEEWPEKTKKAFVKYIKKGGGLVVIHATNNAFPQWQEYNDIIGLGGWGGAGLHEPPLSPDDASKQLNRNEKWGPHIYLQDGKVVRDSSPGSAFHPPSHDFIITVRDHDHPITQGLPEMWLNVKDELYSRLRGPAKNLNILATGLANPSKGNVSPYNEPVLFTVKYGKGRIFHSTLGHVSPYEKEGNSVSVNNVSFITTLQRGAEWAATGKVSQPIPDDFPNVYQGSVHAGVNDGWIPLLDPELEKWEIFVGVPHPSVEGLSEDYASQNKPLGVNNDPKKIFSTYQENGKTVLHITGEIYAGLTSKEEFENYHLKVRMRWGDKKWEPRLEVKRDSGILYHAYGEHGAFWNVWKSSLEYQVQENDLGDFIDLAGPNTVQARYTTGKKRAVYDDTQDFKSWSGYLHAQTEADRPHGQWNTLEIYVLGDQSIHVVNGLVVMAFKDAKDKHGQPLVKGQLQIQSEAAEVEYTDLKVRPITHFPALLKQKAKL